MVDENSYVVTTDSTLNKVALDNERRINALLKDEEPDIYVDFEDVDNIPFTLVSSFLHCVNQTHRQIVSWTLYYEYNGEKVIEGLDEEFIQLLVNEL